MRRGSGFIAVVVLAALAGGCAVQPPRRVTVADANHPIALEKGQDLYVSLMATPSTGYTWQWPEKPDAILTLMAEPTYEPGASSGMVGAGGMQTFWFRAKSIGDQKLRLLYRRPWEKASRPVDVQVFEVQVR